MAEIGKKPSYLYNILRKKQYLIQVKVDYNELMKKLIPLSISLLVLLSGCFGATNGNDTAQQDDPVITPGQTFAVFATQDKTKSFAKVGCDTNLTQVQVSDKKADLEGALKTLLSTKDPSSFGAGLSTASALQDGYFGFDSVVTQSVNGQDIHIVNFTHTPKVGLTGACDAPFVKGQITETVRANLGNQSFVIHLDGSASDWDCLGNESGSCK